MKPALQSAKKLAVKPAMKLAKRPVKKPAKPNHPRAIATLMARSLRAKGIQVRVQRRGSILLVDLSSRLTPPKAELLAWMKRFCHNLNLAQNLAQIRAIQVRGYRAQATLPSWTGQIVLRQSAAPKSTVPRRFVYTWKSSAAFVAIVVTVGAILLSLSPKAPAPMASSAHSTPASTSASSTPVSASAVAPPPATAIPAAAFLSADTPMLTIANLPPHRLSEEKIFDGKVIQADTNNPALTHEQCEALAAYYIDAAGGSDGQIVVTKPNGKKPWNGKNAPFCMNNLDGEGTFFLDEYFD